MSVLPFVTEFHDLSLAYQGHHTPWLVGLSLFMAILAAFASMFHTDIMRAAKSRMQRNLWHLSGSIAMGLGIWAMHFIGMVSYRIDVPIFYTPVLTAISVIPAMLAAWVTLAILYRGINSWWSTVGGGVLMGAGIGTMHYTGMAAMETVAEMRYLPNWFFASIVVAIIMAMLALAIRSVLEPYLKSRNLRISLSAVVMGLAVASMHYTAMHATVFFPSADATNRTLTGVSSNDLIMSTLIVAMFIVVISTVVVVLINKQKSLEKTAEQRGQEVQELTDRLHRIADRVPGMVYQLARDEQGVLSFKYISSASKQLFGVEPEAAIENPSVILQLVPAQQRLDVIESLNKSAFNLTQWQHEFPIKSEPGYTKWLSATAQVQREDEGGVSWSGFISDVTDKKRNEDTIQRLAFYDNLTRLPNRRMIIRELNERIASTLLTSQGVLVWNINLDDFKRINDVHGQEQGDELLKAAAKRIQGCLKGDMLLGRLTADEFIIVAYIPSDSEENDMAVALSHCVLNALSEPYKLPRLRQQGTASIGFVSSYDNEISAEELLRRSDLAVHQAKRLGGNKWLQYHEGIEQEVSERFALESDLREAIGTDELRLYYQLQVNDKKEYIGAEALTRWIHPRRGGVSPGVFIPIAEESGLIIPIGEWVIHTACQQLAEWAKHEETKSISISVNVSARQFYQDNFVDLVLQEVERAGIHPKMLMLELTESLVLEDMDLVIEQMYALKKHGIRFSMDDFGTGYSSLSYLSTLPFDEVKIDQAFIRRAASPEHVKDWSIVEAIIGITKKLNMEVIAEGVETVSQQERLLASGCTRYQGYLFSKPSPISKLPLPR